MRTERWGRSLELGTTSGIDDTLDRWTDVRMFVARDSKVLLEFRRMSSDGRRVLDTYECYFDDETALLDLATLSLQGVIGMQVADDMHARFDERSATEVNALDGPEDIERKQQARAELNRTSRRQVRRVRSKPRTD